MSLFGNGAVTEDIGLSSSQVECGLMKCRWSVERHRRCRSRLAQILPGEITATRQGSTIAAHKVEAWRVTQRKVLETEERRGGVAKDAAQVLKECCDQIIYTVNSVVYYCVKKGRSSVAMLNSLCRHLLLLQLISKVKVHIRLVSTKLMLADYLTRD